MNTEKSMTDAELECADEEAVLRHAFHGQPLDPEVARRVEERAAKITEQIYRTHGVIDDETFQKIISDDDDDELAAICGKVSGPTYRQPHRRVLRRSISDNGMRRERPIFTDCSSPLLRSW
jgi:hypothetical protein